MPQLAANGETRFAVLGFLRRGELLGGFAAGSGCVAAGELFVTSLRVAMPEGMYPGRCPLC